MNNPPTNNFFEKKDDDQNQKHSQQIPSVQITILLQDFLEIALPIQICLILLLLLLLDRPTRMHNPIHLGLHRFQIQIPVVAPQACSIPPVTPLGLHRFQIQLHRPEMKTKQQINFHCFLGLAIQYQAHSLLLIQSQILQQLV